MTIIYVGETEYYIPETLPVGATTSRYVTEDGLGFYISEVNAGIILNNAATLTATARLAERATAQLSSSAVLSAVAAVWMDASATLDGQTSLSVDSIASAIAFFSGGPFLSASANVIFSSTSLLSAETVLAAFAGVGQPATASLTAETGLTATSIVPRIEGTAQLRPETQLLAKAIRVPNVIGHSLVYIVTAPNMWELTSDPDIGPLLQDDTYLSVYHTAINSVDALSGAWRVIILFPSRRLIWISQGPISVR